jgi:cell division septum initiation protein DivIVA
MATKKTIKKVKAVTDKKVKKVAKRAKKETKVLLKKANKQTGVLLKKANKEADKIVKAFKKEWKEGEPQREEYKEKLEVAAKKAGVKGKKMLKLGIKNSIKIGGDVADVIRKDIKEMNKKK